MESVDLAIESAEGSIDKDNFGLKLKITQASLITFAAIASRTRWYVIALCFYFKTLEGTVVFNTTDILSPNINAGPSNVTPNDLSINLISRMSSVAILDATNSEPKVDVSTVFCCLDTHLTGVLFTMTRIPVIDLLVTKSCA